MNKKNSVTFLVVIIVGFIAFFIISNPGQKNSQNPLVSNFEECINAGYPIIKTNPDQCQTSTGHIYIEETIYDLIPENPNPVKPALGPCYVGGCSSQSCSDQKDIMSTCDFRPQYACYKKTSTCERQPNGQCDWTPNSALSKCLLDAVSTESMNLEVR